MLSALRRAVDEDLSGEQRTVFTAVTLHGVPAAALAAALGSNRNAIYKALFEARLRRSTGDWEVRSSSSTYWTATPRQSSTDGPGHTGSREWPRTCAAAKPAIRHAQRAAGRAKGCAPGAFGR